MSCESCSNNDGSGTPSGCRNNGLCSSGGCNKLEVFDWLSDMDLPDGQKVFDIVEVRFKNSRKGFFKNVHNLPLYVGDVVAVEASPGYDVGVVTIVGELVRLQMQKKEITAESIDIKKVYRKAKPEDIEKWKEARGLEYETMHSARKMAIRLGLEMKISDVEYQGDKSKATFFYTADGRVDFRELIKVMADEFKIRIEMRQIGARQEASRLGGIGSCGRELCCSTWLTDFRTVSTSAARYQQLSLNPQKLAGQCGKLKCCLNYELDMYVEAYKEFPDTSIRLQTKKGNAHHQKTDIFKRMMWYSVEGEFSSFIGLKVDRVHEIIKMNKDGVTVEDIKGFVEHIIVEKEPAFDNVVGQDSLTRFDEKRNKKGKNNNNNRRNKGNFQNKGNKQQGQEQRQENKQGNKPQGQDNRQGNKQQGQEQRQENKQGNKQQGQDNRNNNRNNQNNKNRGPHNRNNNPNRGNNPKPENPDSGEKK